jgi:RimJ/RimL family protein N-acetyltransferase
VLDFPLFDREQADALVEFLAGNEWPFHLMPRANVGLVRERVESGEFDSNGSRTHWIVLDAERVGFVTLLDLDDDTPLFDLRIAESFRGQGIGTEAVTWLVCELFNEFPQMQRIEATTRVDNEAMRAVLLRCGFVKEAHYRQAWPKGDSNVDAVGYGVLRADWQSGTTTPVEWFS